MQRHREFVNEISGPIRKYKPFQKGIQHYKGKILTRTDLLCGDEININCFLKEIFDWIFEAKSHGDDL